jgi:hypothetical protein
MTRRPLTRQLTLLMRDARGRFLRIRATLAELARTIRPRGRRVYRGTSVPAQLTLF